MGQAASGGSGERKAAERRQAAAEPRSFARFRHMLLALAALALSVICYAVWSGAMADREAAAAEGRQRARLMADAAAARAAMAFRLADGAARSVALFVEELRRAGSSDDERIRSRLRARVDSETPFRNLAVTDAEGDVRFDGADMPGNFNVADRDFFTAHRDNEHVGGQTGIYISDPIHSRLGRGWFVAVSRRINLPDGGFGGIAYAVIDLSYFERSYRDFDVGALGFVTLWARGGKVLARTPRDPLLSENPGAYAERLDRLRLPEPAPEAFARSPLDGVERWIIAREVDGLPLRVSVGLAEREILAKWEEGLPARAAGGVAAAVVVVALIWALLAYLERLESADAALRESERRSRALFDSTFEYIALLSIDGSVLAANRSLQALADTSASERDKFWKLAPWSISPGVQRQLREGVRRAARGEFVRFESDMMTADGVRTVDISIKPICDDRGQAEQLIAEARDVTDRKRSEDNLRASEARVRSYFEAAMDGIVVADRSGRFVDVNPAACRLFGYERDALTQLSIADMLPADSGPAVVAATHLAQVNASGSYRGELRLRRADGAIRRAEVSAVRLEGDYYLGVFRDVTQQRQEAEALRASNARIAALLRAIPDLALLMDSNGVYIDLATPPSDQRLLRAAKRLLGRRPADVLPVEVARRMMNAALSVQRSQQVETVEFPLELADGARWFEARFTAMTDMPGDESYVLQITRDVTEKVEAAARLADAKEQAEAANRTKSAFLATMSHELRTPLNAVIGFSEIMLSEMFGPVGSNRYRGYVQSIHESGGHLLSLINDVLDISKLEAGKYALEESWVNVADAVAHCCALTDSSAQAAELRFDRRVADDLPEMYCDERALRQVLLNLLSNAVKFTPPGGRVALTAERDADGSLRIAIADTGIGIPADALSRIAQPFQQVDNSIARRFGGTGLGLAISRNLMELHGGRLEIQSAEARGTIVAAVFPAERFDKTADTAAA